MAGQFQSLSHGGGLARPVTQFWTGGTTAIQIMALPHTHPVAVVDLDDYDLRTAIDTLTEVRPDMKGFTRDQVVQRLIEQAVEHLMPLPGTED